jgi:hypothetical protein
MELKILVAEHPDKRRKLGHLMKTSLYLAVEILQQGAQGLQRGNSSSTLLSTSEKACISMLLTC